MACDSLLGFFVAYEDFSESGINLRKPLRCHFTKFNGCKKLRKL